MKAIINGIRYDTDKAMELADAGNIGLVSRSDFTAWSATLYKTPRSARYFLAGEGGAMTMFGHGNISKGGRCGGEKIIPMTESEAFEWAQICLDADLVEQFFGHLIEDA